MNWLLADPQSVSKTLGFKPEKNARVEHINHIEAIKRKVIVFPSICLCTPADPELLHLDVLGVSVAVVPYRP